MKSYVEGGMRHYQWNADFGPREYSCPAVDKDTTDALCLDWIGRTCAQELLWTADGTTQRWRAAIAKQNAERTITPDSRP